MRREEIKGADERKEQNDAEDVQENNRGGERGRDKEQEVETTSRKVEENVCNDDERSARRRNGDGREKQDAARQRDVR